MNLEIFPLIAGVIFLLIVILSSAVFKGRKHSHVRREKSARRVMEKLQAIDSFPHKIAYLRKIDPFVFEELILEAFERRGCDVKRNARYTGDGGIDGQIWIKGHRYIVQAKRYRNHINAQHVRDFAQLVAKENCRGVFVHTGRTGKAAWEHTDDNERVTIISGKQLIKLLTPLEPQSQAKGRVQ